MGKTVGLKEILSYNLLSKINKFNFPIILETNRIFPKSKHGIYDKELLQVANKYGITKKNVLDRIRIFNKFQFFEFPSSKSKLGIKLSELGEILFLAILKIENIKHFYIPRNPLLYFIFLNFSKSKIDTEDISDLLGIPEEWVKKSVTAYRLKKYIEIYRKSGSNYTYILTERGKSLLNYYDNLIGQIKNSMTLDKFSLNLIDIGFNSYEAVNFLFVYNSLEISKTVSISKLSLQRNLFLRPNQIKPILSLLNITNLVESFNKNQNKSQGSILLTERAISVNAKQLILSKILEK